MRIDDAALQYHEACRARNIYRELVVDLALELKTLVTALERKDMVEPGALDNAHKLLNKVFGEKA